MTCVDVGKECTKNFISKVLKMDTIISVAVVKITYAKNIMVVDDFNICVL